MPDMLTLIESTLGLFRAIRKPPGVVTVATSRADEYTPEPQALAIHDMIECALKKFFTRRSMVPRVLRQDYRDGLSVYDYGTEKNLRLFLGKGTAADLPPGPIRMKAKFCTGAAGYPCKRSKNVSTR